MEQSTSKSSSRFAGLDGIRAFAVIGVVMYHISGLPDFPKIHALKALCNRGTLGVDIFFVLSGFLITSLLLREERKQGSISLPQFYFRRAARILPAAYFYLIVLLVLSGLGVISSVTAGLPQAMLFIKDYLPEGSGLHVHYWSLSVEQQFYLLWPLILILSPRKHRLAVGSAIWLILWIHRTIAFGSARSIEEINIWRFDLAVDAILLGCLLAIIREENGRIASILNKRFFSRDWVFLLILPMLALATAPKLQNISMWLAPTLSSIVCLMFALTINRLVQPAGSFVDYIFSCAPIVFLGHISYSMYLWQQLFCYHSPDRILCSIPMAVVYTLLCSSASYFLIEQPFLKLVKPHRSKRPASVPLAAPETPGL